MRKSKLIDGQIMDAVKRGEVGFGVPDVPYFCREIGISTATFTSGGPNTALWTFQ
jgi:hypothetical protein